ncbi:diphthine--ammonia ligase [Lutibacter sp. TH_r2]|uniref:Dph6-related ATP pyrophosphatase n=1 Tax=Lutibacter sp. TH_r2 TaxID=3082083 RepID=UPI002953295F|nr:diphthine--ammonia ligase [Lutibacter sp. TH_r2]MDV7187543.1 diphthine--ammonia ligase [Lutibacter sp. TH_r2]
MNKKKAIFNWSGGKDSALALYHVLKDNKFDIAQLVTTVNSKYNRISMHGVRNELLTAQGLELGLPIKRILLPETPSMEDYDAIMKDQLTDINSQKITHSIFGDIFLEDLRAYRETRLKEVGLKGYFPLWKRDTTEIVNEFIDLGFKTIVVCASSKLLGNDFTGRIIDKDFLKDLPKNVDPCGENGEFHTFVFDGPIFKNPIKFKLGEKTYREYEITKDDNSTNASGFHFCDLIP